LGFRPVEPNYHNEEFRENALGLRLVVDRRGYTRYAEDSPFTRLLALHGAAVHRPRPTYSPRRKIRDDFERNTVE
jgi:hypothetical protein